MSDTDPDDVKISKIEDQLNGESPPEKVSSGSSISLPSGSQVDFKEAEVIRFKHVFSLLTVSEVMEDTENFRKAVKECFRLFSALRYICVDHNFERLALDRFDYFQRTRTLSSSELNPFARTMPLPEKKMNRMDTGLVSIRKISKVQEQKFAQESAKQRARFERRRKSLVERIEKMRDDSDVIDFNSQAFEHVCGPTNSQERMIHQELWKEVYSQNSFSEKAILDWDIILSPNENEFYSKLISFLFILNDSHGLSVQELQVIRGCRKLITDLRNVEAAPSDFEMNFLNRVDNLLAMLVYRIPTGANPDLGKVIRHKPSEVEKMQILEENDHDDGEFNDATEALEDAIRKLSGRPKNALHVDVGPDERTKRLRIVMGGFLMLFMLVIATTGTWAGWESNATDDLEVTYSMLAEQISAGGKVVSEQIGISCSTLALLLWQTWKSGTLSSTSTEDEVDKFMVGLLTKFDSEGVTGVHTVGLSGVASSLVGAYVTSTGAINVMTHDGSGCVCIYETNSDGTRNDATEDCTGSHDCGTSNEWSSTTLDDGAYAWSDSYVLPGIATLGKTLVVGDDTLQFAADITLKSAQELTKGISKVISKGGKRVLVDASVEGYLAASTADKDATDGETLVAGTDANSWITARTVSILEKDFVSLANFEDPKTEVGDDVTYSAVVSNAITAFPVVALGIFATDDYIYGFVGQIVFSVVFLFLGCISVYYLSSRFLEDETLPKTSSEMSTIGAIPQQENPRLAQLSPEARRVSLASIQAGKPFTMKAKEKLNSISQSVRVFYTKKRLRRDVLVFCAMIMILVNGVWNISSDDFVKNVTLETLQVSSELLASQSQFYLNLPDTMTEASYQYYVLAGNTLAAEDLIGIMNSYYDEQTDTYRCDRLMIYIESSGLYMEVSSLTDQDSGLILKQQADSSSCLLTYEILTDFTVGLEIGTQDCLFDIDDQYWYEVAKTEEKPSFTTTYIRRGDGVASMASGYPIYSSAVLQAVIGAEISLEPLVTTYAEFSLGYTYDHRIVSYLVNRSLILSSASIDDIFTIDISGNVLLLSASDSPNSNISDSSDFLYTRGLSRINSPGNVDTALDEPITYVIPISLGSEASATGSGEQSPLILAVLVNYWDFLGNLDRIQTITSVYSFGSIVVLLYIGLIAFRISDSDFKAKSNELDDEIKERGSSQPTHQKLKEMADEIRDIIIDANNMSWARKQVDQGTAHLPVKLSDLKAHASERSKMHIIDSQAEIDVISMCFLEALQSRIPLFIYKLTCSVYYRIFIQFVIVVHICLAFFDWPTNDALQNHGYKPEIAGISFVCLAVEGFEIITRLLRTYHWRAISIISWANKEHELNAILFSVWVLLCINWVLVVGASISLEYVFPIRPVLLILMNSKIRVGFTTFFRTIVAAKDVFLVYFCLVITAAAMGLVLFRKTVNAGEVSDSFDNFIRSMATSFVFVSTGENFVEVVYPAVEESPFYVIYFVGYALMGMFFVVAMVIGTFQQAFSQLQREQLRLQKLYDRTGIIAAFILLDADSSGELSQSEFAAFIKNVRPKLKMKNILAYFKQFNEDDNDNLDLSEFVNGIEKMSLSQLLKPLIFKPNWRLWIRVNVFETDSFHRVVMILLILQIWLLTLYGLDVPEKTLDMLSGLIMIFFSVEMFLKAFFVFGPREFFGYSQYHKEGREQEFIHRFEFFVIFISAIGFLSTRIAVGSFYFSSDEDSLRFVLTLPVLRIFSHMQRTRRLVYTFFRIVPIFSSLVALMCIVIYIFGVIGVTMFAGKFDEILAEDRRPDGNFNSLGDAVLVLFQLLSAEAWHEVMYAAILATNWTVAWYFIAYIILVTTLFSNLLVGVILSVFDTVLSTKNLSKREIENLLLEDDK